MDNKRLYNRFRPTKFSQIVGQGHEVEKLKGIIKNKVYEFSREFIITSEIGGVGKSTVARILAMAINCDNIREDGEPCHECKSCKAFLKDSYSDFISLNGADYNTVDKIKPIIEIANQYPIRMNKFRIILIDEFQRVNYHAQSEFLDVLEFGNNKTIFIFTTTKDNSILQPIKTRCNNITFSQISPTQIIENMIMIATTENMDFDHQSIHKIAQISNGSLREAIKNLDLYNKSFGNLRNIGVNTNHDLIFETLVEATKGEPNEDLLYKIKYGNIKADLSKVLFDIKNGHSSIISNRLFDKHFDFIKMNIDTMIDKFMKYKPDDMSTFTLYTTTIYDGLTKSISKDGGKKGRHFISKLDINKIMSDFGLKRV